MNLLATLAKKKLAKLNNIKLNKINKKIFKLLTDTKKQYKITAYRNEDIKILFLKTENTFKAWNNKPAKFILDLPVNLFSRSSVI